ncbi:MAG: glycosyltransferase [Thermotogae bacterium]|jgi:glycosyltransferase involved in cell wall biosynthesis|nr:glycosyltransferase [Thermotogota bacterium]
MHEISVIIPAYNVENYIGKIINDLENQTFKDFELIIIDDCSKDNTLKIIKESLKNSSMNYQVIISSENGGVSKARNIGMNRASGKYLYFVDADDRIEKECLYTLKQDIEDLQADISIVNYNFTDEKLNVLPNSLSFPFNHRINYESHEFLEKVIKGYYLVYIGSLLYSKALIDKHKTKFVEGAKAGEDREFLIKAIYHSNKITLNNRILFHYVQNQISSTRNKDYVFSVFHNIGTFYRVAKYLEKQNASKEILDYIYEIRIPENIVDALRKLMLSGYPKDKLKLILKNKKIKEAIKKYKFSVRTKKDLKRSIKIYLFRLWPGMFYTVSKLRRVK